MACQPKSIKDCCDRFKSKILMAVKHATATLTNQALKTEHDIKLNYVNIVTDSWGSRMSMHTFAQHSFYHVSLTDMKHTNR